MKLPRFIASTPPPTDPGIARASDIGALTRTAPAGEGAIALGRGLQGVGDMAFQSAMKRKDLDNRAAEGEANARSIDALTEGTNTIAGMDLSIDSALPDNPKEYYDGDQILDFPSEKKAETFGSAYKDYEGKIRTLSKAINFRGEEAREQWVAGKLNEGYATLTKTANAKQQEYQEELYLGNARTAAQNGDMEASDEWIEIAERSGLITTKQANAQRADNAELAVMEEIASIGTLAKDPSLSEDEVKQLYDRAREVINNTPNSVIDAEQSLQELERIDRKEAFTLSRRGKVKFTRNMGINDDFIQQIQDGELSPDMIAESKLDDGSIFPDLDAAPGEVLDKAKWARYAEDSYKTAPTEITPNGLDDITAVITDRTLNREQRYQKLLEARYGTRSITDDAFERGVNRINNPFPPSMLPDIESQMETNEKAERAFGKFRRKSKDIAESSRVNAELLEWIDSEFEKGNEITKDQMNDKSAQLRSGEAEVELKPLSSEEEARRQELLKKAGR
jgi:hypothetical protein